MSIYPFRQDLAYPFHVGVEVLASKPFPFPHIFLFNNPGCPA